MAISIVDLCNDALTLLGAEPITTLTESTKAARLCNRHYPKVRDEVLADHPWNCAIFRQTLEQDADAPVFGWDHAYPLPTDPYCLRPLRTEDPLDAEADGEDSGSTTAWAIEGNRLLVTNASTVKLKYIGRVENVALFDPKLAAAISKRLAWTLAFTLTGSLKAVEAMLVLYNDELRSAKRIDGQTGTPRKARTNTLASVRNA